MFESLEPTLKPTFVRSVKPEF